MSMNMVSNIVLRIIVKYWIVKDFKNPFVPEIYGDF